MTIPIEARTPIMLIGGGGHCKAVIDVIEQNAHYHIVGIVEAAGTDIENTEDVCGYPVIGTDDQLAELLKETPNCVITVGQLKSSAVREKLYQQIKDLGGILPAIVSPLAHIARDVEIGEGTVVMHHCLVNSSAKIGNNCIINSKALIEHDVLLGNHNHVSTAVVLNGDVSVGNNCLIGSAAVVKQGMTITDNVIVGAAGLVLNDLTVDGIYSGTPVIKHQAEGSHD